MPCALAAIAMFVLLQFSVHSVNASAPQEGLVFHNRDAGLAGFYTSLEQLRAGKRQRVRVFHFGDSVILNERVARDIRAGLMRHFGDGGRGQIMMHHDGGIVLSGHHNLTQSRFQFLSIPYVHFNHAQPKWLPDVGFSAWTYRAYRPAQLSQQKASPDSNAFTEVTLIARPARDAAELSESVRVLNYENGARDLTSDTFELNPVGCTVHTMQFNATRHLAVGFGDSRSALVDAVFLETDRGVSYSTFMHKGKHMAWMTASLPEVFDCGYKAAAPSLVIFQFGINESASMDWQAYGFSAEYYMLQMRDFFTRLRAAVPDVSILLIGPYERLKKSRGGYVTYPAMEEVVRLQRQIAAEMNLAFFDSYAYFGGAGQMRRLTREGLSWGDYSHLNDKGSRILGNEIFKQICEGYAAGGVSQAQPADCQL